MTMALETWWFDVCGTGSLEETALGDERGYYWKLVGGLLLVAAGPVLQQSLTSEPSFRGCVQYTILYFSIINGWWLYSHHFASRFLAESRIQSVLVCAFLAAMAYGIVHASFDDVQKFSTSMVVQRLVVLIMIIMAGANIPRSGSFCVLFSFLMIDSMICLSLAGSDENMAPYLWAFWDIVDSNLELFLIIAIPAPAIIPYDLKASMERLFVLILMPITTFPIVLATANVAEENDGHTDEASLVLSFVLLFLFGVLYSLMHNNAMTSSLTYNPTARAILLLIVTLLGWMLSLMGAILLVLSYPKVLSPSSESGDLVWYFHSCAGGAFVSMMALRLYASQPRSRLDVLWPIACWVPFFSVTAVGRRDFDDGDSVGRNISLSLYISVYVSTLLVLIATEVWSPSLQGTRTTRIPTDNGVTEQGDDVEEETLETGLLESRPSAPNYASIT